MSAVITRMFEGKPVRLFDDGAGSFDVVAKDAAEALGYTWQSNVIGHVPEQWKGVRPINTPGGVQQMATMTEPGLYFFLNRSDKPAALPMQMWVAGEVLPSIRKTGFYAVAMTPAEVALAGAQALVAMERRVVANEQTMARIETRVEELAESRVWDHCPQNCEPISKIEKRMNARYGLPPWVVDKVVRELPLSLKPYAMVRNEREEAKGSQYAVYAVADITRIFAQFVVECVQDTETRGSHRHIEKTFQLLPGGKKAKTPRAHAHAQAAESQPA